jgi:hypothetical protein
MANRLLRNIAVSIGAGLALGLGRKLTPRRPRPSAPNLSPILNRLEDIENRVMRFEHTPQFPQSPAPEEIEALGTLVSSQSEDIASIREDILRIEHRNAEMAEAFGQKVALLEQQVPIHIESSIAARMTELEHRLRGEFQEIHHRTVDAFADTIEKRVVGRINHIENSLIEHSHSIVSLREKSVKTDDHLQRLLEAVEKLCARAEAQSQIVLVPSEPPAPMPPASLLHPSDMPAPAASREAAPRHNEPVHRELVYSGPEESSANHFERPAEPQWEPEPQHEPEPELAHTIVRRSESHLRNGVKPVGMAILGLAILGFRLLR